MKSIAAAVIIIILSGPSILHSQDWAKLNPEMNNVLVDTTLLRATIAIIEPGAKSQPHTHQASFFYALTDCKLKVYYTDGQTESFDVKAGEYGYGDPEKQHQTENVGDKTAKFLLIELKEHPYVK
jgi:mannose-6-phosphate isomerase-like protein (cupin superfamily)